LRTGNSQSQYLLVGNLTLFYSEAKKNWDQATVSLSRETLQIESQNGKHVFKLDDIFINNLKQWEGKSVISCTSKENSPFFLGGKKEKITSLFLKITHLQSRVKMAIPSEVTKNDRENWLHASSVKT